MYRTKLDALVQAAPGTWAVVLRDSDGVDVYVHQADRILPSASLIKVPLAWQWLEQHPDAGADSYTISANDICDPDGSLAELMGATVPWRELARWMIVESENNATNIILRQLGGTAAANRWLDVRGWTNTRWRRPMLDFAARAAGNDNTTSARELATMLLDLYGQARLPCSPGASATARSTLIARELVGWLAASIGSGKLEAGLPAGTLLGHKVGDLPDAEHDAGIIVLPDGDWYVLVVLAADVIDLAAARTTTGAISALCWDWMTHNAALLDT